ncbi:MAG TPA: hypothetical protein VJK51_01380 [Candidatus Nanoarchaeia archaeon]|nr:hypothetical protein [Candidatus Nanoarchaeia archaeon]
MELRNDVLKRKEVVFSIPGGKNPGLAGAAEAVVNQYGAAGDCVVVKKIESGFGDSSFEVEAFVYDSVADKEKIERKPKVKGVAK